MTGTAQAGLAVLALVYAGAVFLVRWAVTPAPARVRRPRPVEEWEPAYLWLPAQQYAADCPGCGHPVTIHTTTGSAL